tara:strand:+ start:21075 stop:21584 length:510 start_codon:yes stop_codon:yes gene_type:complete
MADDLTELREELHEGVTSCISGYLGFLTHPLRERLGNDVCKIITDNINKEIEMSSDTKECPKCDETYAGVSALSRADNKTNICSPCGREEAWEAIAKIIKDDRKTHDCFSISGKLLQDIYEKLEAASRAFRVEQRANRHSTGEGRVMDDAEITRILDKINKITGDASDE